MNRVSLFLLFLCLVLASAGQITIIGHNMINNTPVNNSTVTVRSGTATVQTLDLAKKSDFKVRLEYGLDYRIYVKNPRSPLIFAEVLAKSIPEDKYGYSMIYELNFTLVDKSDEDIDTTVFKNAFHRIIFNGKNRMIDDSAYNNRFARNVLKKEEPVKPKEVVKAVETKTVAEEKPADLPVIIAGKVMMEAEHKIPICNKNISALNAGGQVLKTTATNRYGAFAFSGLRVSEIRKIRLELGEKDGGNKNFSLVNTKNVVVGNSKPAAGVCEWDLGQNESLQLADNNFSINVGGKLIASSPKQKKFFANKDVYLSNRLNTVIQKTRTNILGTFVFEDLKPDHSYFIGVDRTEIAPGERVDLLSKEDKFVKTLDTMAGNRASVRINSDYNQAFNDISIGDDEMKMDVKAKVFGDNVQTPIGKLKIILLNDNYEVIDSAITDNLGTFRFKYLPFLKRFYLSAENTDNVLDVFKNILIYSSDDNLIKIMTHQKGKRFLYKAVSGEISSLRDIELEDPWLELIDKKEKGVAAAGTTTTTGVKSIVENILFEYGKYDITPESKEILDKIILVLNTNKDLRIEIGAHTDSKGSDAVNLKLSQMRAKTVQNYIAKSGINIQRLLVNGYGESKLVNDCGDNKPCSELEHAANRRIEFKILGDSKK